LSGGNFYLVTRGDDADTGVVDLGGNPEEPCEDDGDGKDAAPGRDDVGDGMDATGMFVEVASTFVDP